ncbi:hypothetical protein [Streptomyces sp. NPDC097619]|uniref:hypothetical protein n=1 Tax=Streptomyces sp. NPDC097619 TaxID=3157228 RepID=UPI00332C93FD
MAYGRPGARPGEWRGWQVALVLVAALLVFAPFMLYSWAAIGPRQQPTDAVPAVPPSRDVSLAACRVDPADGRVTARVTVTVAAARPGAYRITVDFRRAEQEPGAGAKATAVVDTAGVRAGAVLAGEAVGPRWPRGVAPFCGVYEVVRTAVGPPGR